MTTIEPASPLERSLKQRVTQNPADLDSRRKLARLCVVEGRSQEAAEHYAQLLQKNERDVEALNHLANFYLEKGALDHAFPLFRAILGVNPQHKSALYHVNAIRVLEERGKHAGKITALHEKMIGLEDQSGPLGLRREQVPCLIEMNGDLIWIPGDLLRFLWHTAQKPVRSPVPSFLAETQHYRWIQERLKAGDDVLDVGSNLGIFATMMGAKVGPRGRVFAFEPSPKIASDLRRVLALNELSQVTVTEAAVSDCEGEAIFCDVQEADVRRESSHLSEFSSGQTGLKQGEVKVRTLVLDDFVTQHAIRPSVIKIDVEGAEFLVLAGAEKTLAAHKPKLVIEIHPNEKGVFDHDRLIAYLKRFGYQYQTETKTYYCW